jgi:hypothetical protein
MARSFVAAALLLASCSSSRVAATDPAHLRLQRLSAESSRYDGRSAVKLTPGDPDVDVEGLAILSGSDFGDGTLELDLAGAPSEGHPGSRGFIGLAFHVQADGETYECFYLRMTNGRSDDQFRRNHSAQYISRPAYPWERLRAETPSVYESYVDLVPGAWTHVRVVVEGAQARLYVGEAAEPCLIVHDLKLGPARGAIALWNGPFTVGHYSNLRITTPYRANADRARA